MRFYPRNPRINVQAEADRRKVGGMEFYPRKDRKEGDK